MGWAARANPRRRQAKAELRLVTDVDDVTEEEALTTMKFWVGQLPNQEAFDQWIADAFGHESFATQAEVRRQMLPFVTFPVKPEPRLC
jgi:hypothetical protein